MGTKAVLQNRPGIALVVTLLILLAVGAVATSAALIGSNAWMINHHDERQSALEAAADAGLEEARATINGRPLHYPDSGYATFDNGARVYDANGQEIPGVRRWTYVGPSGSTTGQYGVFGSIVSVVEDRNGDRVIRRAEVVQESFAKFAYFTDVEGTIVFGGGDQIFGPLHSNDEIEIHSTGATFHGPVTTARTIRNAGNGTFRQGRTTNAPRIELPKVADLVRLRGYAITGNTRFVTSVAGSGSQARMRIEFDTIGSYGFIKVYEAKSSNPDHLDWVVAARTTSQRMNESRNCGHFETSGDFKAAADHPTSGSDQWYHSLLDSDSRCFLGGSDVLFGGFVADDGRGAWIPWTGGVSAVVRASGRADSLYLHPINRALNPDFKGIIFVDGKVAVSGVVRGQVTLAAMDDIIIADDLRYATDPGSQDRTCDPGNNRYDILGLYSGEDIIVADNTINSPTRPSTRSSDPSDWKKYYTFDDTRDELLHATLLTLGSFFADDWTGGSDDKEYCGTTKWGRGCLYLTGGVIQGTRGAVGTSAGTGYLKRYSYDTCAGISPPPYYPTTGWFERGRYFEVDPVGFDIDEYFDLLTGGS